VPDIGVVADTVAAITESGTATEADDRLSLRHLELVMEHDVDPYSRLAATVAFSDVDEHEVELEEAYLSHWGLPGGTNLRLGRMYPRIGISASQHLDVLQTADQPLVVQSLFGEDGYFRTGAELSNFLPLPWDSVAHEVIVGVMEGGTPHDGELFGESRTKPTLFARLKNGWDASDSSSLELGTTFLSGSADDDSAFEARAVSLDLKLAQRFAEYNRLTLQSELYIQDRSASALEHDHAHGTELHGAFKDEEEHDEGHEEDHGDEHEEDGQEHPSDDPGLLFRDNPVGWYALLDYRFAQRWGIGGRYDYVQPVNIEDSEHSNIQALSGYLTFFQSEFARFRAQYQFVRDEFGEDDNRVFLQGTFAIGAHKHAIN
jgi:hypothetical protein